MADYATFQNQTKERVAAIEGKVGVKLKEEDGGGDYQPPGGPPPAEGQQPPQTEGAPPAGEQPAG